MTKTYRKGAVGALLDEYERAVEDLKTAIVSIDDDTFLAIADRETQDKDCESIRSVLNHVVRAGYGYANYIRKQFGDPWNERKDDYGLLTAATACKQLDNMMEYTADTLANKYNLTFDEIVNNIMVTNWGQQYDFEQILEHAIVHILRHRRQIEILQFNLRNKKSSATR